jgi:hypothetical protein
MDKSCNPVFFLVCVEKRLWRQYFCGFAQLYQILTFSLVKYYLSVVLDDFVMLFLSPQLIATIFQYYGMVLWHSICHLELLEPL